MCLKCGCYAAKVPRRLVKDCEEHPRAAGISVLIRFARGLPPEGVPWPPEARWPRVQVIQMTNDGAELDDYRG